jgi:hypothetical protein
MEQQRWSFYANEQPVHDPPAHHGAGPAPGTGAPSAQLCGEFVNVLMLRDPMEQLGSMVQEIFTVYRCAAFLAGPVRRLTAPIARGLRCLRLAGRPRRCD